MEDLLTVIITTSPTATNPHTKLIEKVLETFELTEGLTKCQTIIVCDGCIIDPNGRLCSKKGRVPQDVADRYSEYKKNLRENATNRIAPYYNVVIHELPERVGFGFAIQQALEIVKTEFVMIIQHDRCFMKPFNLKAIIGLMKENPDVRCVTLPVHATINYHLRMETKFATRDILVGNELFYDDECFLPLLQFYDSTHITRVSYYTNFIFPNRYVPKSGFIEDKLGQIMVKDIRERGLHAHKKYGTYLYGNGFDRIVQHLDGRDRLADDEFEWIHSDQGGFVRQIKNVVRHPKVRFTFESPDDILDESSLFEHSEEDEDQPSFPLSHSPELPATENLYHLETKFD
jgi:hypothetical protein